MSTCHPRISMLMPVYNGSKYLRKTLDSIRAQTFPEYEVLCVNDCSSDDSLAILEEYMAIDPRIRVLSTTTNLGIAPKVVNWAIPYMRGDYFVYTSQDDLFSPDYLQAMLETAVSTGAEAVIPDMVFFYESEPERNTTVTAPDGDKSRVLTNREAVTLSLDWRIPGVAMFAARLLKEINCYDFAMNAGEYTTKVFLFNCNKVVFSGGTFYYRQDNPAAITKKLSPGTFDYPYTDFRLFEFLRDHEFPRSVQELVLFRSIDTLSDLADFLNTYRVSRSARRESGNSLDIREAERRLRRCFDALRKSNISVQLSGNGSARARRVRIMLASYGLFQSISLFTVIARAAKFKLRLVASRQSAHLADSGR